MSDEPRRSGRATKGQHKNASSSPAPNTKPTKTVKGKPTKKSAETEPAPNEDEPEEVIRCVCGNTNPHDRRAFVSCDACEVWQHNVCMGVTDDDEELPEHYFCEQCRPEEHQETVQSMQRGERIWENRNRMYQNEKKMSKSRKSKGRAGEDSKPAWLKKDIPPLEMEPAELTQHVEPVEQAEPAPVPAAAPTPAPVATNGGQDATSNSKRKREDTIDHQVTPSAETAAQDEKPNKPSRQEKRRKSTPAASKAATDANTAIVPISQLPQDRQKGAQALAKIISDDIQARTNSGYSPPDGQTASSLGETYAARIEYEMHMNHGVGQPNYTGQFRALHANLKKNKSLVQRLLSGSLTASELATMSTSDMASEELQRERAEMKEVLDRQVIAVVEEGPRYRQDHKGVHLIEDETRHGTDAQMTDHESSTQRPSIADARTSSHGQSGSPSGESPLVVDTGSQADPNAERRPTSQHFDMKNIWAKTQPSPTIGTPPAGARTMQIAPRRRSSIAQNAAKVDPDVDRMLEDDDDSYAPADVTGSDQVVWHGKLVQSSEDSAPTVNARFVAGRDLASTGSWASLLPHKLSIDGRLQIEKAEQYLCGLRWSSSSDVTVLSLSPYDNADAFNEVFDYFHSRKRYAVVEKDKPPMVKDLYIIPVDAGEALPEHVLMLEHCSLKKPVEERLLLATLIVARAPEVQSAVQESAPMQQSNGHLPPHVRQSIGGPAGSPINVQNATFSPPNSGGLGGPPSHEIPPNPYVAQAQQQPPPRPVSQHPNSMVNSILGDLQYCPTAQTIFQETTHLEEIQLRNLALILSQDVVARTDFTALTNRLYGLKSA
ncbi:uncharacterized protein RCC_11106 [Ramularia collo-cygni]|uniref:Transcription factor BYE1 n=1 Tax=Ramularia collo-cygni TaxID=112498 RepID=A0A2D3VH57_9PEZI|nr:uncharacterized protein RCC_11106 [Ramularia collo-cygni]CZT25375.1 uncharacterized protein RCC_11106 [Ramularia collo-cygni]